MPYLYRRSREEVDLFLDKIYRKKIVIRDGPTGVGDYSVSLDGTVFTVTDADEPDSSAAIATALEGLINASAISPVTATTSAGVLILLPKRAGRNFSIQVSTTDPQGSMFVQDAPPEAYEIQTASNWDGVFATIETVPLWGLAKPSVGADATAQILEPYIRWRFAPSDYTLEDDDVLYFTIAPVIEGVTGDPSPIYILMTPEQLSENHTPLILAGLVPVAASSDEALEFTLPSQSTSVVVENLDPANTVFLSFGTGDAEIPLLPGAIFRDNKFGSGDIRVRAEGAPVPVYIYLTLNYQRIL